MLQYTHTATHTEPQMTIAALLVTINLLVNSHVTYVAEPAG